MKINVNTEILKKTRIMQGYTQEAFAKKIDISGGYYSQIESGLRNPGPAVALRISSELEEEYENIFFIKNAKA